MQNDSIIQYRQSFFKEDIVMCSQMNRTQRLLCCPILEAECSPMGAPEVHCYNCGCYSGIPLIIFYQFLEESLLKTGICFAAQYLLVGSVSSRSFYFSQLDVTVAQGFLHSVCVALVWMILKSPSSLQFTTEQLVRHTVAFHSDIVSQMSNHLVKEGELSPGLQ